MTTISPRDLYLRQHPELTSRLNNPKALREFLSNHGGIATGWQRVMTHTSATLNDPRGGSAPAGSPGVAPGAAAAAAEEAAAAPGLSAGDQDWVDSLTTLFRSNGLEALATTVFDLVTSGHTGSALSLALQDSEAYTTRFAANAARKRAGIAVLSPAEYLANEGAYRQVMAQAGFPKGFYDDSTDFQGFLERDVSVSEVKERVDAATTLSKKTDPAYRRMLADTWGIQLTDGDIAAYVLDPVRAVPALQRQVQGVGISDAARRQGLGYSSGRALQLAEAGVTTDQADKTYGQIAEVSAAEGRAAKAFGLQYGQADAEDELLTASASAKRKREQVETTFGGYNTASQSRAGKGANSRDSSGSY